MSEETTEVFRAMKEHERIKRQVLRQENVDALRSAGIAFEEKNGGAHVIIRDRGRVFDAWPSTGKWRQRDTDSNAGSLAVHKQSLRSGKHFYGLFVALNHGRPK